MPRLTELPHEMLLEIFERLDNLSLQRLTRSSQRLRRITLILISRQHLQSLSDTGCISLNDAHTIQDLFQPDLNFTPELRLTIYFAPKLFQDLAALRTLILRLDSIHLDLCLAPLELSGFSEILRPQWTHLLAEVMNIVVTKRNSQLTVGMGWNWRTQGRPFHYEFTDAHLDTRLDGRRKGKSRFSLLIRPISRFAQMFTKTKPAKSSYSSSSSATELERATIIKRSVRSCAVSVNQAPASQLDQFHIVTPILMDLPFFHWTMSTILMSQYSLTKLSFSKIDLTHYDWTYILSTLSLPKLSHIAFGSSNIAFPDLQLFLFRQSSITTLDLSRNNAIGSLKPFSSQKILPNLNHLIANSEYLSHFLEPPSAFPNLQSLTMSTGSLGNFLAPNYERNEFNLMLNRMASRKPKSNVVPSLALRFVAEGGTHGLNAQTKVIQIQVGIEKSQPQADDRLSNSNFLRVVKLDVSPNISPDLVTLSDLIEFFATFPHLRHLTFSTLFWSTNENSDPEEAKEDFWRKLVGLPAETIDGRKRPEMPGDDGEDSEGR